MTMDDKDAIKIASAADSISRWNATREQFVQMYKPQYRFAYGQAYDVALKLFTSGKRLTANQKSFRRVAAKHGKLCLKLIRLYSGQFIDDPRIVNNAIKAAQHAFAAQPELRG